MQLTTFRQCFTHCLVTAILAFSLQSCSKSDNYGQKPQDDDGYLHLTFTKSETKASINSDGSGEFTNGDRIGLFVSDGTINSYRELTLDNGEWTPALRRSEFGDGTLTLSAHYPVMADGSMTSCTVDMPSDDILFSQEVIAEGENSAAMTFRHAMHRLKIELQGSTSGVSLSVRTLASGTFDMLTGTVQPDNGGQYEWIAPDKESNTEYSIIILPQSAVPYRDEDGLVKISANGKESIFKAPSELSDGKSLEYFEAGKETTIKLSIKPETGGGDNEWAGKKMWVYGIVPPEDGEWVQLYPGVETTYYLSWKKDYGWYDCNKQNPSAKPGGIPDGNLCWAASASNLMHWWIDRNMEYVEKYAYNGPDYSYPLDKPQESDIFQCFIDSFTDYAGYTDAGANWFIHGYTPSLPSLKYPENHGGYFKDVFPAGTKLSQNYGGLSKNRFNDVIKDALQNRKGLGVNLGDIQNSHAVTIWGAEFDSEGYVSYIYVADNNDRNQFEIWGVGCIRYEIVYVDLEEGGSTTHFKYGLIDFDKSYPINRLVTLDLGQQYWEQYYNNLQNSLSN